MSDTIFRDWQHASRLYVNNNHEYSPKVKFLFHVSFYLSPEAKQIIPATYETLDQIGMLVKSADLPKYTAETHALNMYNRKKHVQTHITYNPITITMHDDNAGMTRHLLEGYYLYYFADGRQEWDGGAFGSSSGDIMYKGSSYFRFNHGMNCYRTPAPFFEKIEISQMAQNQYYMFTLINPMLSDWNHDSLDNGDGGGITANYMTVLYDGVNYSTGTCSKGTPTGFANDSHYDNYEW